MGRRDQLSHDALIGVHVLVVDDDADARELWRAVLEYCGALVTVVPSADEALAVLARVRPDVLVTDLAMPIHDGYWLVEHVRVLPAERRGTIPVRRGDGARRESRSRSHAGGLIPVAPEEAARSLGALPRPRVSHAQDLIHSGSPRHTRVWAT
jgi:CheY-like chemotaxis protein